VVSGGGGRRGGEEAMDDLNQIEQAGPVIPTMKKWLQGRGRCNEARDD